MNYYLKTCIFLLFFLSLHSMSMERSLLPAVWQQEIRAHEAEILHKVHHESSTHHICVPDGSSFFVKFNISRVIHAQEMRDYCADARLDLLYIPQKYLYHIQGRPYDFDDFNYLVVAEAVQIIHDPQRITRAQLQQLFAVIERFGYQDINPSNIVFIRFKDTIKLAIIDTEDSAFEKLSQEPVIDSLLKSFIFEEDALAYLMERASFYSNSQFSSSQETYSASIAS